MTLHAQRGSLKRPLTPEDLVFLKKEAAECFGFNARLQLTYAPPDLTPGKHRTGIRPQALKTFNY